MKPVLKHLKSTAFAVSIVLSVLVETFKRNKYSFRKQLRKFPVLLPARLQRRMCRW